MKYIVTSLISLAAGYFLAFFTGGRVVPVVETKVQLVDTCITRKLLCTLSTRDSLSIYTKVRQGIKRHVRREVPVPVETADTVYLGSDTVVTVKRTYVKTLDNGIMQVWDTLEVDGKILDWNRAYKLDEVIETQTMFSNTVAVVQEDTQQVVAPRVIPAPPSPRSLGVDGALFWNNPPMLPVGLHYSNGKSSFGVQKDVLTPLGSLRGYGLRYSVRVIDLK